MKELKQKIKDYRLNAERQKAIKDEKLNQLSQKENQQVQLSKDIEELQAVNLLLEKCNITARETLKTEIETLVTSALQAVFEDPTRQFTIVFTPKRNQIEAEFFCSKQGQDDTEQIKGDIKNTYGGGVVDVVSIALRMILMELLKINGPIVLDEPGKAVSKEFIPNFGRFLNSMCHRFNRQMILITHNDILANYGNKTIKVDIKNGTSKITE